MHRVKELFKKETPKDKLDDWIIGKIPNHYRRINIDRDEQIRLAKIGAKYIGAYFEDKTYFTQSVIAGAVFSEDYDKISIISCSRYGKSWLMGRISVLEAYMKNPVYVVGATSDIAKIIMDEVHLCLEGADISIQSALLGSKIGNATTRQQALIDKLNSSLSKNKISFPSSAKQKAFVEKVSLGETFKNRKTSNATIGRGGITILDEAALCSDERVLELGRGEFDRIDGKKYPLIQISNPHNTGFFYNDITEENPNKRTLIIWMDILTCVEEGRWSKEEIFNSNWAKSKSAITRYFLCEPETIGETMFPEIQTENITDEELEGCTFFAGIDSAFSGEDNIAIAIIAVKENGDIFVYKIIDIPCRNVENNHEQIINKIVETLRYYNVIFTCVDYGGGGDWIVLALQDKVFVKGIYFQAGITKYRTKRNFVNGEWIGDKAVTEGYNKRAEMYLDLRSLMEDEIIKFSPETKRQVEMQLYHTSGERNAKGKFILIPKVDIKKAIGKSPDEADALVLALHAAILFNDNSYDYIT